MEKTCSKCGQTKPLTEFSKQTGRKYGHKNECRACANIRAAVWRRANRERKAATDAAWRQANPGASAANAAKWRQANPERDAANRAAWYQANRDKAIARSAEWHQANPSVVWEHHRRHQYRQRCIKLGITPVIEPFTYEDVIAQYGDACVYCDTGSFEELDHCHPTAAGGPHTLDNVRPSCRSCNRRKSKRGDRVLINVYRTIRAAIAGYLAAA